MKCREPLCSAGSLPVQRMFIPETGRQTTRVDRPIARYGRNLVGRAQASWSLSDLARTDLRSASHETRAAQHSR